MATMNDPDLIAETRRMKVDAIATAGGELQALIGKIYSTPADIVEKAKAAIVYRP